MADDEIASNASADEVRVGQTVRRPTGPWPLVVHALLAHLDAVGFPGAPKPLGVDEKTREALGFIPAPCPGQTASTCSTLTSAFAVPLG
ncbi:hypothetical protein SAMN04487818_108360 [Actinokineospora terrae]|uniref:Uncharacterized protein n=2 Tax=Actinokineospora terrae TaxID=155974 RepID=A0A1H9VH83_9PSEU|nr:hypothetical protein SAMN04487818_108360 [Actinokineospora terrae]